DFEQAVFQVRALDLDMVGKREAPLERARRDPAIDVIVALLLAVLGLEASDDQHVLLGGDVDLVSLEPGDGELDSIVVIAELDEVERRVILLRLPRVAVFQHVEQAVEPDRGAPERRKVESTTHNHVLQFERLAERSCACVEQDRSVPGPIGARQGKIWKPWFRFQDLWKTDGRSLAA